MLRLIFWQFDANATTANNTTQRHTVGYYVTSIWTQPPSPSPPTHMHPQATQFGFGMIYSIYLKVPVPFYSNSAFVGTPLGQSKSTVNGSITAVFLSSLERENTQGPFLFGFDCAHSSHGCSVS